MYRKSVLAFLLLIVTALRPSFVIAQTGASLTTNPTSLIMGVNQVFVTELVVNTGDNQIGGVGAILVYDPAVIHVDHIEIGTTFSDYPLAAFDNEEGRVAVSGIVGSPNQLLNGVHSFAKVFWKAMSEGEATIRYDYAPGETTESNVAVTTGSGDALSTVSDLTVTVVAEPQPGAFTDDVEVVSDTPVVVMAETPEPTPESFIARAGSFVNGLFGREEPAIDPEAPLTQLPPKTSFEEETVVAQEPGASSSIASVLPFVIGAIALAVVLIIIIRFFKRRGPGGGTPAESAHIMTEVPIPPAPVAPQPMTPVQPAAPATPVTLSSPAPTTQTPPTPPPTDGPILTRM